MFYEVRPHPERQGWPETILKGEKNLVETLHYTYKLKFLHSLKSELKSTLERPGSGPKPYIQLKI